MNQFRRLLLILLVLIVVSLGWYVWDQKQSQVSLTSMQEYNLPARIENLQMRPSDKGDLPMLQFQITGKLDHINPAANIYLEIVAGESTYKTYRTSLNPQFGNNIMDLNVETPEIIPGRYALRILTVMPNGGLAGVGVEGVSDEFEIK